MAVIPRKAHGVIDYLVAPSLLVLPRMAGADVIYVARGRLRSVYLLDAAAEFALLAAWAAAMRMSVARSAAAE